MAQNHKLEYDYQADLLNDIPLSSTGEIPIVLSKELKAPMGFIIIDKGINGKEERFRYHRKASNTVYVYSVDGRDTPRHHTPGAKVILDAIGSINYAHANGFEQMYIFQKSTTNVIIKGGMFFIDSSKVEISDLDTETGTQHLVAGQDNYVYIKDGKYFLTTTVTDSEYPVAIISVEVSGNISNIDMLNVISLGKGISNIDKAKLDSLDASKYEKLINKTTTIRTDGTATDDKYVTEKSVYNVVKDKVDKVPGRGLSENNYTNGEKTLLSTLGGLNLPSKNFNNLRGIQVAVRDKNLASNTEGVTEKGIAIKLEDYVAKDGTRRLSDYNFTSNYKTKLDDLIADTNVYQTEANLKPVIRNKTTAEHNKYVSEKAIAIRLDTKVNQVLGKGLSTNDFSNLYKSKIDNLVGGGGTVTDIVGGKGISVSKIGTDYTISNSMNTTRATTGDHIDIDSIRGISDVLYLDEQKYVVLGDEHRSGIFGNTKFKNASNPVVKVFYHNPNKAGKLLIDTHIRVANADGKINEHHQSLPYQVDIVKGHGAFELKAESFTGLDYTNSNVMYIKVHRVGAYYTDSTGTENNIVLNDLDTLRGNIRVKSMYIDYDQTVTVLPKYLVPVTHTYNATVANDTWLIGHGLDTNNLVVNVYDNTGKIIGYDELEVIDNNNVKITFDIAVTGKAVIVGAKDIESAIPLQESIVTNTQGVASNTWNITHGLGTSNIIVQAYDQNNKIIGFNNVEIIDDNTVKITFNSSVAGKAVIIGDTGNGGAVSTTTEFETPLSNEVGPKTIDHNLNKYPHIIVIDNNSNEVSVEIKHISKNKAEINWVGNVTGKIYAS